MRHLFIINPAAGSRNQTENYRKQIAEICEKHGLEYSIRVFIKIMCNCNCRYQ